MIIKADAFQTRRDIFHDCNLSWISSVLIHTRFVEKLGELLFECEFTYSVIKFHNDSWRINDANIEENFNKNIQKIVVRMKRLDLVNACAQNRIMTIRGELQ